MTTFPQTADPGKEKGSVSVKGSCIPGAIKLLPSPSMNCIEGGLWSGEVQLSSNCICQDDFVQINGMCVKKGATSFYFMKCGFIRFLFL